MKNSFKVKYGYLHTGSDIFCAWGKDDWEDEIEAFGDAVEAVVVTAKDIPRAMYQWFVKNGFDPESPPWMLIFYKVTLQRG